MGLGRVKTHCGECGGKTDKADDRYSGRVSVTKFASIIPSFKSFTPVWCSSIGGAGETSSPRCEVAGKSVPCRAKLGDVE